jgi:hypothetical protein
VACYSNCPFESYWGSCANVTKQGKPSAHCWDGPEDKTIDEEEEDEEGNAG